jgi:alkylated DNA repair dioxygenase AlkB
MAKNDNNVVEVTSKFPIVYAPKVFANADDLFHRLQTELEWERRLDAPRCEYYCNDNPVDYQYGSGRGVRTYSPRKYTVDILYIRNIVEALAFTVFGKHVNFDVCFLNRYLDQTDRLGWHADDSPEMDDDSPIAIVSLGVERDIMFKENADPANKATIRLQHGSVTFMKPGMQDTHQHQIPKAGFECGERISLTFRHYVDPTT